MMVGKAAVAKYPEPCCHYGSGGFSTNFLWGNSRLSAHRYLQIGQKAMLFFLCIWFTGIKVLLNFKKYCESCMIGLSLLILVDCKACDIEIFGMMSFNFIPCGQFCLSRVQPTWRSMLL
jgi:hypothetical protein